MLSASGSGRVKTAEAYDSRERERYHSELEKTDERSPFERDRSRIIHSSAFRRLQGKTQVFQLASGDFFRTRLTHSLEAAQIGKGIALDSKQKADPDLVELACLIHDIGHPPFGHEGEAALNALMAKHGGFEGNAQNLRIIHRLEAKNTNGGLNLTRASIDAIMKYPWSRDEALKIGSKKFYYDNDAPLIEWVRKDVPHTYDRSIECQIMEWADDIAYSTHDLEDAIKSGMITTAKIRCHEFEIRKRVEEEMKKEVVSGLQWNDKIWSDIKSEIANVSNAMSRFEAKIRRKDLISRLVNELIHGIDWAEENRDASCPSRYRYTTVWNSEKRLKCLMLKNLVWILVINDERVAILAKKASHFVGTIFEELGGNNETLSESDTRLLPADFREMLAAYEPHRVIADYIAGMTDAHALKVYSRLRESDTHSMFENL